MLWELHVSLTKWIWVSTQKIHAWRVNGRLVEGIKQAFGNLPENLRGRYYPWFLQNQWVLDSISILVVKFDDKVHADIMIMRAWIYSGQASSTHQEIAAAVTPWPEIKNNLFVFCIFTFSRVFPHPTTNYWVIFSFCVCPNGEVYRHLSFLYHSLIENSSLDELYTAYESSSLIALMDCKGLEDMQEKPISTGCITRGIS